MLNIVWVLRGISAEKVRLAMQGYIDGRYKESGDSEAIELARKYKLDYSDKYRSQMMYILLGLYAQNKKYYSFNTFAYLSSGAVNDFISLCRNVFYLLDETYYANAALIPVIPIVLQARGAENTAIEQMDKIRLCSEYGTEMYSFAMNIGGLFKLLHRDIYAKYPETNQFAFENEIEIESRPLLKEVRNSLIKWGVIIKRPRIQSISVPDIFRIFYVFKEFLKIETINVVYAEPGYYNYFNGLYFAYEEDVVEREYTPLSEYFTSAVSRDVVLVCFLGFERLISKYIHERKEHSDVIAINGFPAYYPKLKDISLAHNYELISTIGLNCVRYAQANNPFSAYNTLVEIKDSNTDKLLDICVLGSKPMALGACMFALRNPQIVKVSYPFPKASRVHTSIEVSNLWLYTITL